MIIEQHQIGHQRLNKQVTTICSIINRKLLDNSHTSFVFERDTHQDVIQHVIAECENSGWNAELSTGEDSRARIDISPLTIMSIGRSNPNKALWHMLKCHLEYKGAAVHVLDFINQLDDKHCDLSHEEHMSIIASHCSVNLNKCHKERNFSAGVRNNIAKASLTLTELLDDVVDLIDTSLSNVLAEAEVQDRCIYTYPLTFNQAFSDALLLFKDLSCKQILIHSSLKQLLRINEAEMKAIGIDVVENSKMDTKSVYLLPNPVETGILYINKDNLRESVTNTDESMSIDLEFVAHIYDSSKIATIKINI